MSAGEQSADCFDFNFSVVSKCFRITHPDDTIVFDMRVIEQKVRSDVIVLPN